MRGKPEILRAWEAIREFPDPWGPGMAVLLEVLCDIRDTLVALGTLCPPKGREP